MEKQRERERAEETDTFRRLRTKTSTWKPHFSKIQQTKRNWPTNLKNATTTAPHPPPPKISAEPGFAKEHDQFQPHPHLILSTQTPHIHNSSITDFMPHQPQSSTNKTQYPDPNKSSYKQKGEEFLQQPNKNRVNQRKPKNGKGKWSDLSFENAKTRK